jgi:hypothetical protein
MALSGVNTRYSLIKAKDFHDIGQQCNGKEA